MFYTPLRRLPFFIALAFPLSSYADNNDQPYSATLPTVQVEAQADTNILKGYINYEEASATRNNLTAKEIPQSIDTINIQKNKNYGTNDLSSILEGNAGIDASYDMRGENIYLRGFSIDANDIYRDGMRESGQVRRSTANVERVEILKGPASVLYGRSNGGGIVNMVSKTANFKQSRNIGLSYGSWANRSLNMDINQVINDNVALRLTGEYGKANSFRSGIDSKNSMISPSISIKTDGGLKWTGQYTYDNVERVPDRSPTKTIYDQLGLPYNYGFAHPNDYVKDKLEVWNSNLEYAFSPEWQLRWQVAHRKASQDFDHYFAGTLDKNKLKRNYAWQQTDNKTLSSNLTLNGDFKIAQFDNHLTLGLDLSKEERNPTLATRNGISIDPYNRTNWPTSGRLLAATIRNQHHADSYGLFLQDVLSITPIIKFSAGGRYDKYQIESTDINNKTLQYSGHSFSPNFGAVWDITPAHTLYTSFNKSFSPYGGRSYLGVSTTDLSVFDTSPQHNKQYEAGIKSAWFNNRLSTTLSAYQIEHYNIRYRPDATNQPFVWAVSGKERSRGIELSAVGQLAAKWYLRGSLGVMNAKVAEDKSTPTREGKHLSNTSNVTGNVFVRYTPTENIYTELGVTGTGKRYILSGNTQSYIPGFARVDALVGWNYRDINLTFAAGNLLNQQYWRSDAMPGTPRNYTFRVNYSF